MSVDDFHIRLLPANKAAKLDPIETLTKKLSKRIPMGRTSEAATKDDSVTQFG